MLKTDRRSFIKIAGGVAAAGAFTSTLGTPHVARAATGPRVVVVGGGTGGATVAKYLRRADPSINVTLIEPNQTHHTCYMSNEVIGGVRPIERIQVGFDGLRAHGVTVVHDSVTGIDAGSKKVTTAGGASFDYDKLVLSPGISLDWTSIEGYDEAASEVMPHAWKAGAQTALLRRQLEAMDDGGTFILVAPPNPYRCPPGPYERASLVANYFKQHKPKSKVLILDPKDAFSKQGLFTGAWRRFYGFETDNSMIEWVPAAQQGKVNAVSVSDMTAVTDFDAHKGAVINVVPAQKAGEIAIAAGLTNESGFCPINMKTFESTIAKDVHVIGDAAIATTMPKSGYSANSQGKVCAQAIAAAFAGREMGNPSYVNTCYSMGSTEYAFSVAGVYRYNEAENRIVEVEGAGGLSPADPPEDRLREVTYAHSWYDNIIADTWG